MDSEYRLVFWLVYWFVVRWKYNISWFLLNIDFYVYIFIREFYIYILVNIFDWILGIFYFIVYVIIILVEIDWV